MAAGVPIAFQEVLNLQQLQVPETSIKHGLTTMESDKWIVSVEPNQVSLIDLQNQAQVTRRPIKAEAAVMNPSSNILALRSGKTIQMFNLDSKSKLKSHDVDSPSSFGSGPPPPT
ncbi:hypothetical protein QTG54_010585 [Skeletonema marinoi]|uniref:Uncharacterized protein n=1 Tax=Skeletonema marinoi TaxID=267567 RepID=A0AAD9DAD7_9STRA|nr:hypothetical protein QTG54_010585 [Skeletonema marinoi]